MPNESTTDNNEKRRMELISKFAEGLVHKTKALYERTVDSVLDIGMNDAETVAATRTIAYLFEYLSDSFRKDQGVPEEVSRDLLKTLDKVAQILATRLYIYLGPNKGDSHGSRKETQGDPQ